MEIIQNTALKLLVPDQIVPHITDNIEKAEVVSRANNLSEVMVYWGVQEMTKLNQLIAFRKNLPSPIERDYKYPGLYKPFDPPKNNRRIFVYTTQSFLF
jgi:hypothetical protein